MIRTRFANAAAAALLATAAFLATQPASAEFRGFIQYGVPHTFNACFFDYSTGIDIEPTITFEDGDIALSIDGTEDATAGNDLTKNDNGKCFDIVLSAAQTSGAFISVIFDDDDDLWLPTSFEFATFGSGGSTNKTLGIASGVAQSATNSTITLASATNLTDDLINDLEICIVSGTGAGQFCPRISDWVQSTDTATIDGTWVTNPDSTSHYIVRYNGSASLADLYTYLVNNGVAHEDDVTAATGEVTTTLGGQLDGIETTLGSPAGASVSADLLVIDNFVDELETLATSNNTAIGAIMETINPLNVEFVADSGTTASLTDAALTQADTNYFVFGSAIVFTSGNLEGVTRCVDSFVPASDTLTFSPPTPQAVSTHSYYLISAPACDPFH